MHLALSIFLPIVSDEQALKLFFIGENYYLMKSYTSTVHSAYSHLILLAFHSLCYLSPHPWPASSLLFISKPRTGSRYTPEGASRLFSRTQYFTRDSGVKAPPGPMCHAQSCASAHSAETDCSGHVMLQRWHFAAASILPIYILSLLSPRIFSESQKEWWNVLVVTEH